MRSGTLFRTVGLLLFAAAPVRADPYSRLAKALTRDLKEWAGKKAAVVEFSYPDGRPSAGGWAVAQSLQTELVRRGEVKLVERAELEKVLREIKLQASGLVPADSALKAGRLAGADLLVTGTLTELGGDRVEVNARLVRVENGELLRAAKETLYRTWSEAPAVNDVPPGAVPAPQALRVLVSSSPAGGAARRLVDRSLAFRYADQGGRPVLRVTDYTHPSSAEWTEVPISYFPGENRYEQFSRDFHVGGREYRVWTDFHSNLKVAPLGGLFGRVDEEKQIVVPLEAVFQGWIDDIEKRSATLFENENGRLIAYFEPMEGLKIRISVFFVRKAGGKETLNYAPKDVEVLKGRRGHVAVSRLLEADSKYFRFRYNADSRDVTVEDVR